MNRQKLGTALRLVQFIEKQENNFLISYKIYNFESKSYNICKLSTSVLIECQTQFNLRYNENKIPHLALCQTIRNQLSRAIFYHR